VLKAILGTDTRAAGITRSELESGFLRFLADRGLPSPRTNVWLQLEEDWIEADCVWSDRGSWSSSTLGPTTAPRGAFRRDRAATGASRWRGGN
jgi:hypothetical protein